MEFDPPPSVFVNETQPISIGVHGRAHPRIGAITAFAYRRTAARAVAAWAA